jgi:hypothetical protein
MVPVCQELENEEVWRPAITRFGWTNDIASAEEEVLDPTGDRE